MVLVSQEEIKQLFQYSDFHTTYSAFLSPIPGLQKIFSIILFTEKTGAMHHLHGDDICSIGLIFAEILQCTST